MNIQQPTSNIEHPISARSGSYWMLGSSERAIKYTLIILALSLLLTACSRRDARLDKQIEGTWTGEANAGTMTFSPDGAFSVVRQKPDTNIFAGTWQIQNGVLIMTLTNAPTIHGHSLTGGVTRCRVVSMDAHRFVYESNGRSVTLSR